MPEVVSSGYLSPIPFSAAAIRDSVTGRLVSKTPGQGISGYITAMPATVSAGGFGMLDIPLVAGRHFTEADAALRQEGGVFAGGAVIINQVLAQRLWPEENNVIGNVIYDMNIPSYEVVGVVRNYHHVPGNRDFIPTIYFPYTASRGSGEINILVKLRANTSLQNFQTGLRQRLSGFAVDWVEVQPLSERVKYVMANQRLTLQLLGCFAVLGIIVSGLAVYATASLMVTARKREIGIRMAIGAQPWNILRLVLWRGIRAILLGLPFGLFLAWILSRVLSSFLVHVVVDDLLLWLTCCVVLLVITTVAALIPALQALRINPMGVIRGE